VFIPEALRHLIAGTGPGQIMIGTDYPFPWTSTEVAPVLNTSRLSDEERIAILGVFAGQGHDLADRLRRERRWRAAAGRIAQTRRHAGRCRRIPPPAAPVTCRLAPNPQLPSRLADPQAGRRQQDDPCPFRQLLWRRMRPHQIVQFPFMFSRQLHR